MFGAAGRYCSNEFQHVSQNAGRMELAPSAGPQFSPVQPGLLRVTTGCAASSALLGFCRGPSLGSECHEQR